MSLSTTTSSLLFFDTVVYNGGCSCGECKIKTYTKPIVTLTCHCSNCLLGRTSGQDTLTISMFWLFAVEVTGPVAHQPTSNGIGGGIQRTSCSKCHTYGICSPGTGTLTGLVFVACNNLDDKLSSTSAADIYYNSGVQPYSNEELQQRDHKTILYSDLGSFLYMMKLIVTVLVPNLAGLLWNWTVFKATGYKKAIEATTVIKQD